MLYEVITEGDVDQVAAREAGAALHDVLQLADVARPAVGAHRRQRLGGEPLDRPAQLAGEAAEKMEGERLDVLRALRITSYNVCYTKLLRIAFSRLEGGRFDIYTIRPDGSDEQRLTFGPGNKERNNFV